MNFAKSFLLSLFTDANLKNPLPLSAIYQTAKLRELCKSDLKTARKALGIESLEENGIRVWFYPKEPRR